MPQMGVSVSEGTITKWLKQPGEAIARDEALLEISTDKVDTEIPSPGDGVVGELLVAEGETVEVGTLLATILPAGAAVPDAAPEPVVPVQESAAPAPIPGAVVEPPAEAPLAPPPPADEAPGAASGNGRTFVSPVVARIAAEHGVDPQTVTGTGTGGRVTKKDILTHIEAGGAAATAAAPAPAAPAPAPAPVPAPAAAPSSHRRPLPRRRPRRPWRLRPRRPPDATRAAAPCGRGRGADERDAARRDGAHAPLARHLGPRHERDRGGHVEGRRGPRAAEEGVPVLVRRQPDLPRLHRQGDGRDAAGLQVDQRRDPRREDHHAPVRQPRYRGLARGRQGPDRAGDQERAGPEPARDSAGNRRSRRPGTNQEAPTRRRARRDVHDHEPGRLRHVPRHPDHQPASGGDPRHLCRS